MNEFEEFLKKSKDLNEESISALLGAWTKEKHVHSKEILLDFNHLNSKLYFVVSGCVKLFVNDEKNEEICIGFGYNNTFITCFQSFIEEKPSILSIEAILQTKLLYISKDSLKKLIHKHKQIANWYQAILEKTISGHIQRQVELLTLSPQQKYQAFMKRGGHLINLIPLKYIASYLMMKPETLSRVRANIN